MTTESVVILLACVLMATAFARSKYIGSIMSLLPISFIPLAHLLTAGILRLTNGAFFGVRPMIVHAFADVIALVVTCAFIVYLGHRIKSKLARSVYLVVMLGYSVIIGWVYILNSLGPLFG